MTLQLGDASPTTITNPITEPEASTSLANTPNTTSDPDSTTPKPSRIMSSQSSPIDSTRPSSEPLSAVALDGPSISNAPPLPIEYRNPMALQGGLHGLSTSAASSGGFTLVTSASSSIVDVDLRGASSREDDGPIGEEGGDIDIDPVGNGASAAYPTSTSFISHLKSELAAAAALASNGTGAPDSGNGHHVHDGPLEGNGHHLTGETLDSNGKMYQPGVSPLSLRPPRAVTRVSPPGNMVYPDSSIQREEYVRLVLQSLRDIGYHQAATVLEAESGYMAESQLVTSFRESVLEGRWDAVEGVLEDVGIRGEDNLKLAHFLVRQQKYLECLEAKRADHALQILRNELAPLAFDSDRLHVLSSLMMCTSLEELNRKAEWNGTAGGSRADLLAELQAMVPASTMLPPRRMESLLLQAQDSQRRQCLFHNSRQPFSLYTNHDCGRNLFPSVTTNVLAEHDNEVWNVEWSSDGRFLASGGKDRDVIIWSVGPPAGREGRMCHMERKLQMPMEKSAEISALAWSPDNSQLLACSEGAVRLWDVKSGECIKEIKDHSTLVTAVRWLPDRTGFVTAAFDTNIFFYDVAGNRIDSRSRRRTGLRVVDFEISPNGRYLVAVGQPAEILPASANPTLAQQQAQQQSSASSTSSGSGSGAVSTSGAVVPPMPPFDLPLGAYSVTSELSAKRTQMVVYDLLEGTKRISQVRVGDMTSVKITRDSKYALINYAPNVLFLWDIEGYRLVRRYMGHLHESYVLRSCFGGADETWIVTGDEDHSIRVWHRDTGDELEILEGHKAGGVNAVSWNPVDDSVFASCSDDGTIRIWEAPNWTLSPPPQTQSQSTLPPLASSYSPKTLSSTSLIQPSDFYLGGGGASSSTMGTSSSSRSFFG